MSDMPVSLAAPLFAAQIALAPPQAGQVAFAPSDTFTAWPSSRESFSVQPTTFASWTSADFATQSASSPVWAELSGRVRRWFELSGGWDGEDGLAPAPVAVQAMIDVLVLAEQMDAPLPTPLIAGDGEVGLRWRKGEATAFVSYMGPHEVLALVRDKAGRAVLEYEGAPVKFDARTFLVALTQNIG